MSLVRISSRSSVRSLPGAALATLLSLAVGVLIAQQNAGSALLRPNASAELLLVLCAAVSVLTLRRRVGARAGHAVHLSVLALSAAFLLGLWSGGSHLLGQESRLAVLFALAVAALVVGALVATSFAPADDSLDISETLDPFRHPLVVALLVAVFAVTIVNFATGSIALLAGNVDATRFGGAGGALTQLWAWVIGGLEWAAVLAGIRAFVWRRLDSRGLLITFAALASLFLLAGRSFFVIVGLALLIPIASLRRLSMVRLALIVAAGLLVLGVAGLERVKRSDPAQRTALQVAGRDNVYGMISQSAVAGPSVFAVVLNDVPSVVPYQGGRFALRDFRASLPLHLFGRPERADYWATEVFRNRDPAVVGGSPPTLVGGLFIDFGIPGIVIGSAVLGAALALLYRWACRAKTVGSVVLYGYLGAYVALSAYSYVSVKPAVISAVLLSLVLHHSEKGWRRRKGTPHQSGVMT